VARGEVRRLSRWGVVSLTAAVALGLAGCHHDTTGASPAPSPTLPPAAAGVGGPRTTAAGTPVTATSPASPSAAPVLADGRHAAYLTSLDVATRTLTFDKIDFLTGEAAKKAYLKQNPGETDGPPDDYMIVNNNPMLRTLPVAGTAKVTIVDMSGAVSSKKTTLAALPAYFAPDKGGKYLWHDPFWLTVKSGQITGIEEQFLP
jgi:hypothetical protein